MTLKSYNPFGDEIVLRSIDWLENFPWQEANRFRKDKDAYEISLNVKEFDPAEISVKISSGHLVIEASHEEKKDDHGYVSRKLVRRYPLPEDCVSDKMASTMSGDGILTVVAPRRALVRKSTVIPVKHEAKSKL